jgi:ATP-dependent DNA helicase DinG
VGPMECPGAAKCPSGNNCFSEAARAAAAASTVIVVNLHLYALHLSSGGVILPEHEVVIIDEAHQLEDIVSSAAGLDFSAGRFASLARNARSIIDASLASDLTETGGILADLLGNRVGDRVRFFDEQLQNVLNVAASQVNEVATAARKVADESDDGPVKQRVLIQAGHLAADLVVLLDLPSTHVAWVEGPGRNPSLRMAPIDVASFMRDHLWKKRTVVMASATLDKELPERLGLTVHEYDRVDVGSPFDYERQAMLYCALALPNPKAPNWLEAISDELVDLVNAAGGRTLALFTSWRAMDHVAEQLNARVDYRVLNQRELPKPALIRAFTDDETSVLCATMGFWQGVDIPGAALRLVTIDRLPFPRPDDPLLEARRERAGGRAFSLIDLPRTATMLAQGAGRLIRTSSDRGVVAVLDPRLGTARYRWDLVNALPPMKRTRHRDEVIDFLRSLDRPALD